MVTGANFCKKRHPMGLNRACGHHCCHCLRKKGFPRDLSVVLIFAKRGEAFYA